MDGEKAVAELGMMKDEWGYWSGTGMAATMDASMVEMMDERTEHVGVVPTGFWMAPS